MRILYFHQHFTTPDGSGGSRSYEFARKLVERGHEVILVCGGYQHAKTGLSGPFERGMRRGKVDGIDVIEIEAPYSNYMSLLKRAGVFFKFSWDCTRLALTERVDVVFATTTPLTIGIPGIAARWLRGLPFVFEVRDLWPELPKAMGVVKNPLVLFGLGVLEKLSYRSADRCIGLSPGIVEGIEREGGRRVTLIPNCADLEIFKPAESPRLDLPGIEPGDFTAIFTGAHGIANGLEAVLDAAAALKARGRKDIKLVFIGDGQRKPALVERAKREGLDNCLFFPPVPKRKIAQLTASANAGLMVLQNVPAFYHNTSPNKFFDYLASGLPVINNYPGWVAGMIEESGCGRVVPPADPKAFADALIELADDREKARRMGAKGRQLAEKGFAREKMAEDFARVLEQTGLTVPKLRQHRIGALFKRLFDFSVALVALTLFSPVLLMIALLVRLKLGSPVLFRQSRPGHLGKSFRMIKFRTMTDARDANGKLLPDEVRLTGFGKFLRATSLDELPELWNVLVGNLSLVGPRPLLESYLSRYSHAQARRHLVKPGITGWAQINGRNSVSWSERFAMDCWYVDHWSFWLDLKILFMTIPAVLSSRGISAQGHATMPEFTSEGGDRSRSLPPARSP